MKSLLEQVDKGNQEEQGAHIGRVVLVGLVADYLTVLGIL